MIFMQLLYKQEHVKNQQKLRTSGEFLTNETQASNNREYVIICLFLILISRYTMSFS